MPPQQSKQSQLDGMGWDGMGCMNGWMDGWMDGTQFRQLFPWQRSMTNSSDVGVYYTNVLINSFKLNIYYLIIFLKCKLFLKYPRKREYESFHWKLQPHHKNMQPTNMHKRVMLVDKHIMY